MTHKPKRRPTARPTSGPKQINIRINHKGYRKLSRMAKQEGRTIAAMLDVVLAV